MNTDFLLIGGDCGGLETAIHLRKLVADATITIVNPKPDLIYRPWLIYLPAQHRRFEELQISLQKAAATYRLHLVIDTVRRLDHANQRVLLADGQMINYRYAVLATGAPADRERLPGSAQHALFPCDVEEALTLTEKFLALKQGQVSVIIAGERPGPGLEYAGWLATAAQEHGLTGQLQIHIVADQDSLRARLGDSAMNIVMRFLAQKGAKLITGRRCALYMQRGLSLRTEPTGTPCLPLWSVRFVEQISRSLLHSLMSRALYGYNRPFRVNINRAFLPSVMQHDYLLAVNCQRRG
jgi:NADH dehydrogenase FAD-containing subunit